MKKTKRFNLVTKLELYLLARDIYIGTIKIPKEGKLLGLCRTLLLALVVKGFIENSHNDSDDSPYSPYNNEKIKYYFIEIWKQKPEVQYSAVYWWHIDNRQKRIDVFDVAIADVRKKIHHSKRKERK